eukprot:Unigene9819_Nuclearia_a/m.29986 Unigene9819_Nuclearia_a/g.29986  ORF Unigene9819_Nuclearia_a/g.29986 Unigene9819_Nuclearia_a/m.29986 type:complete len:268 (+) Unigene9819_Nuclearia_a:773-1576(+)
MLTFARARARAQNRDFSVSEATLANVNVMLNHNDKTAFLKLSRNGLEARNDSTTFESVRATAAVTTGAWFYEVTVNTSGVLQIGWASRHCQFDSESGNGVGDDVNSISYDGCRRRMWHRGNSDDYGSRQWRAGDVVGVMIDIEDDVLAFTINGSPLGDSLKKMHAPPRLLDMVADGEGLCPAASFMAYQHCTFNFGASPFKHPPSPRFKPLNASFKLTSEQQGYLPRLARRSLPYSDDGLPRCEICCDRPPDTVLMPCKHGVRRCCR